MRRARRCRFAVQLTCSCHCSHCWMKQLDRRYDATMVYGHNAPVLAELLAQGRACD
jgi:hypothetical protein